MPHDEKLFNFDTRNQTTVFRKTLCPSHLLCMYGLEEKSFPMQPTNFLKDISGEHMYSCDRGYTLIASQSFKTTDVCDNIVFKKDDVIFPTANFMKTKLSTLSVPSEAKRILLDETAIFVSKPITKLLRKILLFERTEPVDLLFQSTGKSYMNVAEITSDASAEAKANIIAEIYCFYYENAFYPKRDAFDLAPLNSEKRLLKNVYSRLKESYDLEELHRDQLKPLFENLKIADLDSYSGQFFSTFKGFDIHICQDIDRDPRFKSSHVPPSMPDCKGSSKTFLSADKLLWHAAHIPYKNLRPFIFSHSLSIPGCDYEEDKGIVATRDIYDQEELLLEQDHVIPLSSWQRMNLLRNKPKDICDFAPIKYKQPREPQIIEGYKSQYDVVGSSYLRRIN